MHKRDVIIETLILRLITVTFHVILCEMKISILIAQNMGVHAHQRAGVNFTNVLRAAFTRADPKSAKKQLNLTDIFALLGS